MSEHFSRAKISSATSEMREWKPCLKALNYHNFQYRSHYSGSRKKHEDSSCVVLENL